MEEAGPMDGPVLVLVWNPDPSNLPWDCFLLVRPAEGRRQKSCRRTGGSDGLLGAAQPLCALPGGLGDGRGSRTPVCGGLAPDLVPLLLTTEGEFVVKNLILIAAGLVVGGTVQRGKTN